MADGERERRLRINALSNFTRKFNDFTALLQTEPSTELLTKAYTKVDEVYDKLEQAQEAYLAIADIDVENDEGGVKYLDAPGKRYNDVLTQYSAYMNTTSESERVSQQARAKEIQEEEVERQKTELAIAKEAADTKAQEETTKKFESAKNEFTLSLETFKRFHLNVKDVVTEASDKDKRREWKKLEDEFKVVGGQLTTLGSIDHLKDVKEFQEQFIQDAEEPFKDLQKWFMSELKESSETSLSETSGKATSSNAKSTKKEEVKLPYFKGDEKSSPFLKYSIWRKQWEIHIQSYEENYRATLLGTHLDDAARNQIVGWENDYPKAMSRLDVFYGNPSKVVTCVMKEVNSQSVIVDGDYKSLLSYSVVLENNFTRLTNLPESSEHEMSNTSQMSAILQKFPRSVEEKWNEYLSQQSSSVKVRPFPELVVWMASQREIWERMSVTQTVKKGAKCMHVGSAGDEQTPTIKKCYNCDEEGHIKRFCKKEKKKPDKEKQSRDRERKKPRVKKHWCAYHKEDPSRLCTSLACQDVRKAEPNERVRLLKENGDCPHCIGDHKPAECKQKSRICGGGKDLRGCAVGHNLHELFCVQAKCFAIFSTYSVSAEGEESPEGVLLQIMNVKSHRKGKEASVFWDGGSTSDFVREGYAKAMGFTGKIEHLCVTTLGGVVKDITVTTYSCSLRDTDNKLEEFEAYGLESITGVLTHISPTTIKKLFPNLSSKTIDLLIRGKIVDFLLGLKRPSWQPERAERAKGKGDLWIYRGKFGQCLGGRHPEIVEGTRHSDCHFTVNFVYYANVVKRDPTPHSLAFCSDRVSAYTHKAGFCETTQLGQTVCQATVSNIRSTEATPRNTRIERSSDTITSSTKSLVQGDEQATSVVALQDTQCDDIARSEDQASVTPVHTDDHDTLGVSPQNLVQTDNTNFQSTVLTDRRESAQTEHNISVGTTPESEGLVNHSVQADTGESSMQSGIQHVAIKEEVFYVNKPHALISENSFFELENLCTWIDPKCGSCKCGKCSPPGSKYSFSEQKQYDQISNNLTWRRNGGTLNTLGYGNAVLFLRMIGLHYNHYCH